MSSVIITRSVLRDLEDSVHRLRNQFPMGIRGIDDEREAKIGRLQEMIKNAQLIPEHRVDRKVAFGRGSEKA